MLSNKELYHIADSLGMIEDKDKSCCCYTGPTPSAAETFAADCKSVLNIINFVNELTLDNSLETIKQFLIVLFAENYNGENLNVYEGKD